MSRASIDMLLYLLDEAFEGHAEHSLLGNLRNVSGDDWKWKPDGATRSIRDIATHAGVAKHLYAEHLFGAAQRNYFDVISEAPRSVIPAELEPWIREGHACFRRGVETLEDDALGKRVRSHWGEVLETRFLIATVIEHDLYHAGEINHLRALRQDDDRWPGQPRPSER